MAASYRIPILSETGFVFKLTPTKHGYVKSTLYAFGGHRFDGAGPLGGLVMDAAGILYGTTAGGGRSTTNVGGTFYTLTPTRTGYRESVQYSFGVRPNDGYQPESALLIDRRTGELYGTTTIGGTGSTACLQTTCGTVYKLTPTRLGYAESVVYSFVGGADGDEANSGLVADRNGALYGVTAVGGATGGGVVYKLIPTQSGFREIVLHTFGSAGDGDAPGLSQLILQGDLVLGTTVLGGDTSNNIVGNGTVFALKQ